MSFSREQTQCFHCVMDRSASEITFNKHGICNFCNQANRELDMLTTEVPDLRTDGEYDVLIGLSGGVDSSFTLHNAVKLGLRPLCFTIDNGWNKPEADENIMRLVETLKVPFYRKTIDIPKFRKLQAAFIQAGVKNIEIPTDHILMAASFQMADEYNIKTILSGGNVNTESIMPPSWGYSARDLRHIKSIYKRFTGESLKGLPTCSLWQWNYYRWVKKIRTVYLLDYLEYDRQKAEQLLISTYGFQSTGEKHEESYFTWWFQNYYLFKKFGIDKRKAHYSSLINAGQMTRKDALEKLKSSPVYPEIGLEDRVLKYPKHEHSDYPMDKWYPRIAWLVKYAGLR